MTSMKVISGVISVVAFFCLTPQSSWAQQQKGDKEAYSRVELFGGYSYFNVDPKGDLIFDPKLNDRYGRHGFGFSVAGNITRRLGVVADFSFHRKELSLS